MVDQRWQYDEGSPETRWSSCNHLSEYTDDAAHSLRYGEPTREQMLAVLSVYGEYRHLLDPNVTTRQAVSTLRAIKARIRDEIRDDND